MKRRGGKSSLTETAFGRPPFNKKTNMGAGENRKGKK